MPLRLPFARAIIQRLRLGERERYELAAVELAPLSRILQATLRKPNAVAQLVRALKLAEALEETLGSPTASRSIIDLLRAEPEAVELIRKRILRSGGIDEMRKFQKREGRLEPPAAPALDTTPEPNAIRLSTLLDERCAPSRRMR